MNVSYERRLWPRVSSLIKKETFIMFHTRC
jgi:hypothetical protein